MTSNGIKLLLFACFASALSSSAATEVLRWSRAGDALTLDPHAVNEGPTLALAYQIMEPLVARDMAGELVPALATQWEQLESDPSVWRFTLRENVRFHDGAEFDSSDVEFSLNRAQSQGSGIRGQLGSIQEVRAEGKHSVLIKTRSPNQILPHDLVTVLMLDQGWADTNQVSEVQKFTGREGLVRITWLERGRVVA